ncbi:mechanosensitive ion channel domain-containing protein [Saccharicrinis fermentans]|nr:mechanosensitive ion channel domain-containing protein [Saccharicrinis fermentans]
MKFFITASLVFLGYRILFYLKNKLNISHRFKYQLDYVLSFTELFFWIGFIVWVTKHVYESRNYFILISIGVTICIFAVPLFLVLRDFISGAFLKVQNKVNIGCFIEIDEMKGQIKKAGHLRLDIEDAHGNIHSIPYYNIRSKTILQHSSNQHLDKVILKFSFPETITTDLLIPHLKKQILNTPWVSVSQSPVINKVSHKNNRLNIEVGVYTLNKSYADSIHNMVTAQLKNMDGGSKQFQH